VAHPDVAVHRVRVDDVETPPSNSPADVLRPLSPALGAESLALNYFELAPGERFGFASHRHLDQEEVFYVRRGTVTFETESGDVEVSAGEAVRFAPGEFQLGWNRGDERVVALAVGAPRDSTEIEYRRACPDCDAETIQVPERSADGDALLVRCRSCGGVVDEFTL
jgi:uncharacterized cupin superfamily protein